MYVYMCIYHMYIYVYTCVRSYSKVGAVEQRNMANSGAKGTKRGGRPTSGPRWVVPNPNI